MSDLLKIVADNPPLYEELKGLILKQFELGSVTMSDLSHTNEQLGEFVRARVMGAKLVENAFAEIARHKRKAEEPTAVNRAR